MTTPDQHMRNVVVRHLFGPFNEGGGALIPDVFRRDITFRTRRGLDESEHTMPGIALTGGPELDAMARAVGTLVLKIMRTDELLWIPLNAHRALWGGWDIECVPLVEWLKLTSRSDEQICKASGVDPETGLPVEEQP